MNEASPETPVVPPPPSRERLAIPPTGACVDARLSGYARRGDLPAWLGQHHASGQSFDGRVGHMAGEAV